MNLNIDLTNVKVIEVVESGVYRAKLIDVEETESSAGNPMLAWTWEILGKENAGAEVKSFTSLLPNALFGLKGHLSALGVQSGKVKMNTDKLLGRKATLTIVKIDDGGEKNRVNKVAKYTKPTAQVDSKKSETDVNSKKSDKFEVLEPLDDEIPFNDSYSEEEE